MSREQIGPNPFAGICRRTSTLLRSPWIGFCWRDPHKATPTYLFANAGLDSTVQSRNSRREFDGTTCTCGNQSIERLRKPAPR